MPEPVVRLTAQDYDEALDFLNLVFSQAGRPHDFERMLPKMCIRDDVHMGRHFAIRQAGRIQSMLGVYPLPLTIAGRPFLFATVGNVATHNKARSQGYMSQLLETALQELDRLGADAARLDGLRQRYNRSGFEKAGTLYTYTLTVRNVKACFGDLLSGDISFLPLAPDDIPLLEQARSLHGRLALRIDRGDLDGFDRTLRAWQMEPWAALDPDGQVIGYLAAAPDRTTLAEQVADSPQRLIEMLCAWVVQHQLDGITFTAAPWQPDICRLCNRVCERFTVSSATSFLIRNWSGISDALLALKAEQTPLLPGRVVIAIEGYGALAMAVEDGRTVCAMTDRPADLHLDRLTATRLLFGPMPPELVCDLPQHAAAPLRSWLPLPLSWNGQDRV
jgi:GNAT superfamily N-acetyltransferase